MRRQTDSSRPDAPKNIAEPGNYFPGRALQLISAQLALIFRFHPVSVLLVYIGICLAVLDDVITNQIVDEAVD